MSPNSRRDPAPEIRCVRRGDEAALREIRLRSLADAPMAFAATVAEEAARAHSDWMALAASSEGGEDARVFVAVGPAGWLGLAAVRWFDRESGIAQLWGMWVAPEARRLGLGARLVERVSGWAAAHGALRLRLGVIEGAAGAQAFYERLGFVATGETKPLARDPATLARFLVRAV